MLDQGRTYPAYSGDVPRDSSQALLLRRAWESLRRNTEFQENYAHLTSQPHSERLEHDFRKKWGLLKPKPHQSFDDIVGAEETLRLDDPAKFDDVYRRLYGDTFYGEDKVVQCEDYNALYRLLGPEDFKRVSALARGQSDIRAPRETLQDNSSVPQRIDLTIDVDQNPIAILFKVKLIIQALREARVQAGKAKALPNRIKQQLATLEKQLDADIVGDGRRDFGQDEEVFRIWNLSHEGRTDDEIARVVWPIQHGQNGGARDNAGDRTAAGQRVYDYKTRAEGWIELFTRQIKDERVTFPPR